ncbi:MAG TPA: sugar transferase [Tissierellaceae bacterium]
MPNLNVESYYKKTSATTVGEVVYATEVRMYDYFKRVFDIIFSLIGLIIAFPIMVIFSILIVLETPGSPIYCQERVGKNGKHFKIYKLRSMYKDAEANGAQWAEKDDPRVTKMGRFIRRTRIDELPQLFNVLKGDMSIVGPRPERPIFTYKFNEEIPGFINRLKVKPGITGWAQVNGGYELTPAEKLQYDLYYIENRSLWLDIKIILKTVKIILTGEGAW